MSGVFNLADVLELIIDRFNDRSFPKHEFFLQKHERVLHVLLDLGDEVQVIHKEHLKEVLADISPVGEEFPEELRREAFVLQRCPIVYIPRRKLPPG